MKTYDWNWYFWLKGYEETERSPLFQACIIWRNKAEPDVLVCLVQKIQFKPISENAKCNYPQQRLSPRSETKPCTNISNVSVIHDHVVMVFDQRSKNLRLEFQYCWVQSLGRDTDFLTPTNFTLTIYHCLDPDVVIRVSVYLIDEELCLKSHLYNGPIQYSSIILHIMLPFGHNDPCSMVPVASLGDHPT